jgi:hypothetical protein
VNFSHSSPRRLSTEQMFDAVGLATRVKVKFAGVPREMRARLRLGAAEQLGVPVPPLNRV